MNAITTLVALAFAIVLGVVVSTATSHAIGGLTDALNATTPRSTTK